MVEPSEDALAHEDPAGCFETTAVVLVSVFRADGVTGVVGSISECETIKYRVTLQKGVDLDSICAFSGGTLQLKTPDGVVHDISTNVPCIGGNTGLEGCDDAINSLQSAMIPYTVSAYDVAQGFVTATTNYAGGFAHDREGNTPGIIATSAKSTPVVFCATSDPCTTTICDPALSGSAACSNPPIVCDDGNLCTTDSCNPVSGDCEYVPLPPCDDDNLCTADACDPATGQCVLTPTICNDSDACTVDTCNPLTGLCVAMANTCDDHDPCTLDTCDPQSGQCTNTPAPFPGCGSCGDGIVSGQEQCDAGPANGDPSSCCTSRCEFRPATAVCRPQAGICDASETCTGISGACPAIDAKRPSGTSCPDDGYPCTADRCDGVHDTCQHPAGNAGTVCRASRGECDPADACDGVSTDCPDVRLPNHTPCTDDGSLCTTDECNGFSIACKHTLMAEGSVCRPGKASSFGCDAPEVCTRGTCPPDLPMPIRTRCSDSDGLVCTDEQCDGSGTCIHVTLPRFTPCGDSDFCDGTVCRHLPSPTCGIQEPPKVDDGEECDDGVNNDTDGSCCTFDCKFKDKGRECATATVPQGVCNGRGSCVRVGECGNGMREDVAFVDGTAIHEDCDLGELNGVDRNQGSCCDKSCRVQDGAFICQVPPNSCLQNSTCGSASFQLPEPGECPTPLPVADGQPCFVACRLGLGGGIGGCSGGACVGTPICGVDLIRKGGTIPRFALGCRFQAAAGVSGSATCQVDQVAVPLGSILSADGLVLVKGNAAALRTRGVAAAMGERCTELADGVRAACDVENERAFCCARARLRANRKPEKCKRSECYAALVALGKGCPAAIGEKSQTLEVGLVAKVTGLMFQGQETDQDQSGTPTCPKKGTCKTQ